MLTQLPYWLIASVLLVATFWYRTYRANRTLAISQYVSWDTAVT